MKSGVITFDKFIRGVIILLIIIGVLFLIKRLSNVLLPFFVAWLIAYLIFPLVSFFQYKLRMKYRIIAIICSFITIIGVGAVAFYLLVPPMVEEMGRVKTLMVEYFSSNLTADGNVPATISDFLKNHIDREWLDRVVSGDNFMETLKEGVPKIWDILTESINIIFSVFTFFIMLLYVVFILLDYETLSDRWVDLVPRKYREATQQIFNDVKDGMNRYFRGQAVVALCVGILFSIGFLIIDFPLAIGLGLFIGALNMVPYLQILGFIPTILLAILKAADTGQNFWVIMAMAVAVFCVVQAIQDGIIVPRIMGKITGLNPAIILLSLSIWGSLMGMVGMIIALPLTTLLLSYYQRFFINKEKLVKNNSSINQDDRQFE